MDLGRLGWRALVALAERHAAGAAERTVAAPLTDAERARRKRARRRGAAARAAAEEALRVAREDGWIPADDDVGLALELRAVGWNRHSLAGLRASAAGVGLDARVCESRLERLERWGRARAVLSTVNRARLDARERALADEAREGERVTLREWADARAWSGTRAYARWDAAARAAAERGLEAVAAECRSRASEALSGACRFLSAVEARVAVPNGLRRVGAAERRRKTRGVLARGADALPPREPWYGHPSRGIAPAPEGGALGVPVAWDGPLGFVSAPR